MFLTVDTSIEIHATPEAIWDFASDPENWTASNPTEHFGLNVASSDNRPHTGVTFTQRESVAGVPAELCGRFHYVDRPRLASWTGTAAYRLLAGLFTLRLPEGGVLVLQGTDSGSVRMEHNVYIEFPDTTVGRICRWFFETRMNGRQAVYDHSFRESNFFKRQLESDHDLVSPTIERDANG